MKGQGCLLGLLVTQEYIWLVYTALMCRLYLPVFSMGCKTKYGILIQEQNTKNNQARYLFVLVFIVGSGLVYLKSFN